MTHKLFTLLVKSVSEYDAIKKVKAAMDWLTSGEGDELHPDAYYIIGHEDESEYLYVTHKEALTYHCKINAYPNCTDEFRKGIHDCTSYGGRGIIPSFLFIDLDKGAFNGNLDLVSKA